MKPPSHDLDERRPCHRCRDRRGRPKFCEKSLRPLLLYNTHVRRHAGADGRLGEDGQFRSGLR